MKKPLFMLTLLLAIGLAGCGTKDSAGADTAEVAQEESTESQDSAEAGDKGDGESGPQEGFSDHVGGWPPEGGRGMDHAGGSRARALGQGISDMQKARSDSSLFACMLWDCYFFA